jgi:hypothetical protein
MRQKVVKGAQRLDLNVNRNEKRRKEDKCVV